MSKDSKPQAEEKKRTLFARAGADGSLWGAFLEKAFAKHYGNFKHIEGGDPRKAVNLLYGSPYHTYVHFFEFGDDDKLWEHLKQHEKN